jgi:hypothetical protein
MDFDVRQREEASAETVPDEPIAIAPTVAPSPVPEPAVMSPAGDGLAPANGLFSNYAADVPVYGAPGESAELLSAPSDILPPLPLPPWRVGDDWRIGPTFRGGDDSHRMPQEHDRDERKREDDPRGNANDPPPKSNQKPPNPYNPFTPEEQKRIKEQHQREAQEAEQRRKALEEMKKASKKPPDQPGDYNVPDGNSATG